MSQFVLLMTRQPGRRKSPKDRIVAVRECLAKKDAQLGSHKRLIAALHNEAVSKQQELATMRQRIVAARSTIAVTCEEVKDLSLELNLLELELRRQTTNALVSTNHAHGKRAGVAARSQRPIASVRRSDRDLPPRSSSRPKLCDDQNIRTISEGALMVQHAQQLSKQGYSTISASDARRPSPQCRAPAADARNRKRHRPNLPMASIDTDSRRYPPPPSPDELFSMCVD